jgi:hypothetical protein
VPGRGICSRISVLLEGSVVSEWQAFFALDEVFLKFAAHVFWRAWVRRSVCRWLQAGLRLQEG